MNIKESESLPMRIIIGSSFAGLLIYLLIRTIKVDLTIDESASVLLAMDGTYAQIIDFFSIEPGNHFLNTILIKFFISVFGNNPAICRLPNVLAFGVYAFFAIKLLKMVSKETIIIVSGFLFLCLNAYLLDWFSLARGYGLSYGFMMAVVYYIMKFESDGKILHLHLIFIFSIMCILSSLVMLPFFLSTIVILAWFGYLHLKNHRYRQLLQIVITTLLYIIGIILFIAKPINNLRLSNQFYFGGYHGFWEDTVFSVIKHITYGQGIGYEIYILIALLVMLVPMIVFSFIFFRKNQELSKHHIIPVLVIFFLPPIISVLQHKLLGTPYLIQRSAVQLVLFYFITIVVLGAGLSQIKKFGVYIKLIFSVFSVVIILLSVKTFNVSRTNDWPSDIGNHEVIVDLITYAIKNKIPAPIDLHVTNLNIYSQDYYNRQQPFQFFVNIVTTNTVKDTGFFYFNRSLIPNDIVNQIDTIKIYPFSGYMLFRITNKAATLPGS